MNRLKKPLFLCLIVSLFFSISCEEAAVVSCNYAVELQDEVTTLSNAASAYGQDQSAANCEAYRQAFLDYLEEAEKLDNCVLGGDRVDYLKAIEDTRASLDDLTC